MKRCPKAFKNAFGISFLILQAEYIKFINCTCDSSVRFERDASFDGIVPAAPTYYLSSYEDVPFVSCVLKCHQSAVLCTGFLYNSITLSCKLLKLYLTENDKNTSSVGNGWEYRYSAGKPNN